MTRAAWPSGPDVPGVWSALFWGLVNLQGGPTQSPSLPAAFPGGLPGLRRDPTPRTVCPLGRALVSWLWQPSLAQGQTGQAATGAWAKPGPLSPPAPLCVQWFDFFFSSFEPRRPSLASSCPITRVTRTAISFTPQLHPGSGEGLQCMHMHVA